VDLEPYIRSIPDFPKKGIVFRDITTLIADAEALRAAADALAEPFRNERVDLVVCPEARGFIFGALVADRLGAGLVPVRKPGKLPAKTIQRTYDLEYGTDTLTMHADAITRGQRVLVLDDLLATGGTIKACCDLARELGAKVVGCAFVIELSFLRGREKLKDYRVVSLVDYESE